MYLNFILENFELLVVSILLIITICILGLLLLQNKFIKITGDKIENYNSSLRRNNSELAEYLKTLSSIIEMNKTKLEQLIIGISDLEKKISTFKAIKGDDDLLTLAIDLVRSGSSKEEIKTKTGLNEDEIETIYAYHKNVKN